MGIEIEARVFITAPDDESADEVLKAIGALADPLAGVYVQVNERSREATRTAV